MAKSVKELIFAIGRGEPSKDDSRPEKRESLADRIRGMKDGDKPSADEADEGGLTDALYEEAAGEIYDAVQSTDRGRAVEDIASALRSLCEAMRGDDKAEDAKSDRDSY